MFSVGACKQHVLLLLLYMYVYLFASELHSFKYDDFGNTGESFVNFSFNLLGVFLFTTHTRVGALHAQPDEEFWRGKPGRRLV